MGEIGAEVMVQPIEGEIRLSIKLQPNWFGRILINAGLRKQETATITIDAEKIKTVNWKFDKNPRIVLEKIEASAPNLMPLFSYPNGKKIYGKRTVEV